jgi:hypothetical protein
MRRGSGRRELDLRTAEVAVPPSATLIPDPFSDFRQNPSAEVAELHTHTLKAYEYEE